MFGIGAPELLVILAVALIVIGPKKLPDLARSLGKALGEFRRATNDLKQSIEQETGLDEIRKDIAGVGRDTISSLRQDLTKSTDSSSVSTESQKEAAGGEPGGASEQDRSAGDQPILHPGNDMEDVPADNGLTPKTDTASAEDDQGKSAS